MNEKLFERVWCAVGVALLLTNAGDWGQAAPLTWFPGPSVDPPFSGAAAVVDARLGNIVIAGDGLVFPENLVATNSFWNFLPAFYDLQIAPGAVDAGDFIIVYGGNNGTSATNSVVGYSPSGDTPPALTFMGVARAYLGSAADASGNAYAIGGLDNSGNPLASAERYSQDANSWSPITSMPTARYNFPAVFDHTNRIYVFGGITDATSGTELATVLYYSTRSNNWNEATSMPVATAGSAAAFAANGKIYVVGGTSGGVVTNLVQIYAPAANSWTVSTPLPEALSASAMGVDSLGRLVVMGGMDVNGNDVGDVWRSQQLGVPDSAPVFTQLPGTNGIYGSQYDSLISATGNPQPTYQVTVGPANLAVDVYSGAIAWTPQGGDQIGSIPVTIQASNYAGATNWTFNITVPPPPPTIPTNLVVAKVTDNSVALTWDPEDPLVGPVTFKIYRVTAVGGKGGSHPIYTLYATSTNNSATIALPEMNFRYGFVVAASANGVTTRYSYEVGVVTTSPQGPTNVWVTAATPTTVGLAWTPSPGPDINPNFSPIISYTIMERSLAYYPPADIPTVTNIATTNGTIIGLLPGGSHIWFVSGVDGYGNASSLSFAYVVVTNPPPPRLGTSISASGGGFQFSASEPGAINQTITVEATTNPADPNSWVTVGSLLLNGNAFTFTDTNAVLYPNRFYRIATP